MTTSVAEAGEVICRGRASRTHRGLPLRSRHDRRTDGPEGRAERGAARAAPGPAGAPAGLREVARRRAGVRFAAARLLGRRPGRAPAAERRRAGAQGRGAAVRSARRAGARGRAQARRRLGRDAHSPRPLRIDGCARHGGAAGPARAASSSSSARVSACCRAGRSSSRLAELGEDDRKALAQLGVRVGVYSLYFPSMLKPVPIRLRAGLWMIARNRETIPPLPAEGRTSMDLPHGAERDFYAAIGYLPLGDHAIRADMVERLAAMARQAVRESREAARRAAAGEEAASTKAKPDAGPMRQPTPRRATDDEISEWAIVAAAFGESEPDARAAAEGRRHVAPPKRQPPKRPPARRRTAEARGSGSGRAGADRGGDACCRPTTSPEEPQTEEVDGRSAPAAEEAERRKSRRRKSRSERPSRGPAAPAAGLVPRHAADDVAGRLLGARDGRRAARPGLSRPSAVGRERPAACLLGQAALRARARGAARAPAPAGDASAATSAAASGPSGRTSGSSSPTRRAATAVRTAAAIAPARPPGRATEQGATADERPDRARAAGSAARRPPRAAPAAPRHRRPGAAPLRHDREEGRCARPTRRSPSCSS